MVLDPASATPETARENAIGIDGVSIVGSSSGDTKAGAGLTLVGKAGGEAEAGPIFFAGQLEVRAVLQKGAPWSVEAAEGYAAYAPAGSALRLSAGRKLEHWSQMDESFGLGLWQPRFLWNRARPEQAGLTGLSAGAETANFRVQGSFLPVFIPDRGYPVAVENGQLLTQDPFFDGPGATVPIHGQPTPVRYTLSQPAMTDVLFNPGFALLARVGERRGGWAQANYAYKPMNQLRFAYDSVLRLDTTPQSADVTIYPDVLYHHIAGLETGYRSEQLRGWISFTSDSPVSDPDQAADSTYLTIPVFESAQTYSLGGAWEPKFAQFSVAYLHTVGGQTREVGENAAPSGSSFEGRYPYSDAAILGATVPISASRSAAVSVATRLLADFTHSSSVWSTEIEWRLRSGLRFSGGADLLASGIAPDATGAGDNWISRYRARDRFHVGMMYAF